MIDNSHQVDSSTASQTRLSKAHLCVEVNLCKECVFEILLQIDCEVMQQKVSYDFIPRFCDLCSHLGHNKEECYVHGDITRPHHRPVPNSRKKNIEKKDTKGKAQLVNDGGSQAVCP